MESKKAQTAPVADKTLALDRFICFGMIGQSVCQLLCTQSPEKYSHHTQQKQQGQHTVSLNVQKCIKLILRQGFFESRSM